METTYWHGFSLSYRTKYDLHILPGEVVQLTA